MPSIGEIRMPEGYPIVDGCHDQMPRCLRDQVKARRRTQRDGASEVGRRIREFRTAAGITQEALARDADLTPKFVSQIENGRANPSIAVLERLVQDGLGVPLATFFANDGDGDLRADLVRLAALFSRQPARIRRQALRVLEALVDDPDPP